MRILFSTPPAHYLQGYTFKYPRFPWLSLPALAATVKSQHNVKIISHTHLRSRAHTLFSDIESFKPDVLAFAAPAPISAAALLEHLPSIKRKHPNLTAVGGGQYPSVEPEELLRAGCDIVAIGESDSTFPKLIEKLERSSKLLEIEGIAFINDGKLTVNPNTSYPENLDSLPIPAFELWPSTHRTIYKKNVGATMELSRGCPFRCTFCVLPSYHRTYREKSATRVLEELEVLRKLGIQEVMFADATFALNPEKTFELAEQILTHNYKFEFIAFMRAETAHRSPKLIEILAKAGLKVAIVGFESYSDLGLTSMDKSSSAESNAEAVRVFRKCGIFVIGSHVYGLPPESYREALSTYCNGVKLSDHYMAGIFTPLPGSSLFDSLREQKRLIAEEPNRINYTEYLVAGGPNPTLFRMFSAMLYLRYYVSPKRWLSAIFGPKLKRAVLRSEYRLLFWRTVYSVLRALGIKIL